MDFTYELALQELQNFGIEADLRREPGLPSFEIRVKGGRFIIAAPDSLEMLYAVYDLAERFGGYSFFEPGRDCFNQERKFLPPDGIAVPACQPLLKRRGFIQEFPFNAETGALFDWMAKNKLNYLLVWMKYYDNLSAELKEAARIRGIVIESGHHNFNYWIPGRKYSKGNPEFFAQIDGRRIESSDGKSQLLLSEQLCTSNPELRGEIVKNMLDYCQKHPEVQIISLVPNDGFGWCECDNCARFYDKEKRGDLYSLSAHVYKADLIYHDLLRDVAQKLRRKRPDLLLTFCAYVNYCAPSPGFKLSEGLAVHFAPYWRCINHTIDDQECPINSHYAEDLRRWQAVKNGGEINIYEYFMGVNFYLSLPMIHFQEMFREMRWYSEHDIDGILTQFHIPNWSVYGINYALMARAARGEKQDEAISELMRTLFGADIAEAEAFYGRIKKLLLGLGDCHIPYPYSLLSRSSGKDFHEIQTLARKLLEKSPRNGLRLELLLWSEYLIRFKELFDQYQAGLLDEPALDRFLEWIHAQSGSRVFVQDKFDVYFQALRKALRDGTEWLHFNLDWEDEYIRQHRQKICKTLSHLS